MKWITKNADIRCPHSGKVNLIASQDWVQIETVSVLVAPDPEARPMNGCILRNILIGEVPCSLTLPVISGYSGFIHIDGQAVCLDAVTGKTVGSPPGVHDYTVKLPGQSFIEGDA